MSEEMIVTILSELRAFKSEVREEFRSIRSEVSELRTEVSVLRTELSDVKTEIQLIKKDQHAMLNRLNSHEKLYAQLIGMVKSVKETVDDLSVRQDDMERKYSFELHRHSTTIDVLNREQLMMKTEIELLKNRY